MKVRNCKNEEARKRLSRPGRMFIMLSVIAFLTAAILAVSPSARLSGAGKAEKLSSQEADANTDADAGKKPEDQKDKKFSVYFIDVGQGDASLITCDGHSMLIDGGRSNQSDKIYAFLKSKGVTHLDYIVATHPDDDHIGGLAGALNYATAGMALSPVPDDDSQSFQNFKKYLDMQGVEISVPISGDHFSLGSSSVTVLGPIVISDSDNNNSIVLKIDYGEHSFLFTGDAEKNEENDILNTEAYIRSTVIKIGHHGSASSSGDNFLSAVNPTIAVISCGIDNEYGHPTEEVLERLKQSKVQVFRTDIQGDITITVKCGQLSCEVEKKPDANVFVPGAVRNESQQESAQELRYLLENESSNEVNVTRKKTADTTQIMSEMDYVVNTKTRKFHFPDCRGVKQIKESNREYVTCDRQDLIKRGYESCGICHP